MGEHRHGRVGVFECFIFIFEAKTVMKSPVKCQVCPTLDLGQATCWDKRQSWTEVPNHCVPGHLRPGLDFSEKDKTFPGRILLPALEHDAHQERVDVAAHAGADLSELHPLGHGEAAALGRTDDPGPGQVGLGADHDALLARQQRVVSQAGQRVPGQN